MSHNREKKEGRFAKNSEKTIKPKKIRFMARDKTGSTTNAGVPNVGVDKRRSGHLT